MYLTTKHWPADRVWRRTWWLLAGLVPSLLTACGDPADSVRERRLENFDKKVARSLADIPDSSPDTSLSRQLLVIGESRFKVGESPRSEAEEFGFPGDAIILDNDIILVTDKAKHRVVVITENGETVRTIGRKGQGPGEFEDLSQLVVEDGGVVSVLDNRQLRLVELKIVGTEVEAARTRLFQVTDSDIWVLPQPMCVLGNEFVALSYDPISERTLHRVSAGGEPLSSFGLPFTAGSNGFNEAITTGRLLCLPDLGLIVLATARGDLVGFSADGEIVWRRRLDQFHPIGVREVASTVVFDYAPEPDGKSTRLGTMQRLSPELGLLQLRIIQAGRESGAFVQDQIGVDSRIFDLRTGTELGRQADLPIVMAIRDGWALFSEDEPAPWLELRALSLVRDSMRQ